MNRPLERFRESIAGQVSGLVAVFDLADSKRRNCFLGYQAVDQDIAEFGRLLKELIHPPGNGERVAGDKWAVVLPGGDLSVLEKVIHHYQRRTKVVVGWQCIARLPDGRQQESRAVKNAWLHRAVRCGYTGEGRMGRPRPSP